MYLFSFPFRFLFATIVDLTSFFWSIFNTSSIPIDYDPLANIAEFAITYNQKYGTNHPQFYQGSYSQAVNEAKRDLKFLLIFIHQNDNKDSHLFASETLPNPELIEFINNTFIFWSCSKNLPEGQKVYNALKARRCPFLGVIVLKHARSTLVSKIEGPITAAELMLQLNNLIAENEHDLVVARLDRDERSQTQLLRQQQDEAYLESLKIDQEKSNQKQLLAEEMRIAQELEKQKIAEEKTRENNILNRKSELRQLLANTPQPEASNELTLKLIIKLPNGNRFERFFLKTEPLSSLYKFVFCNEESPLNFEIVTNFPRKVIECTEDTPLSIQDFGITQSMILFVNDLDA
jgi:FAS-associated factor 2